MNLVFIFLVLLCTFLIWCSGCFLFPKFGNWLYNSFKNIKEKMNEGEIEKEEKENIEK